MEDLIIVEVNGENRIDSRLVAKSLGIEHESFSKTLSTYQAELKELGVFRFEVGKPPRGSSGGRPEKYAMLNEDQSIFASTLSRNTKQVVAFKLKLTKAFAEVRKKQNTYQEPVYFNKQTQDRCRLNEKLIPEGFWAVETEMVCQAAVLQVLQKELQHWALPSGSGGKKWVNYLRRINHPLLDEDRKIALWVPNLQSPTKVLIYPYELLSHFRKWLRVEYAEYYDSEYSPPRLKGTDHEQIN